MRIVLMRKCHPAAFHYVTRLYSRLFDHEEMKTDKVVAIKILFYHSSFEDFRMIAAIFNIGWKGF